MRVGDRVLFVAERNAAPRAGTVTARYGSNWADLALDDGTNVDQAFIAVGHFQSPRGHYCVIEQTDPALSTSSAA